MQNKQCDHANSWNYGFVQLKCDTTDARALWCDWLRLWLRNVPLTKWCGTSGGTVGNVVCGDGFNCSQHLYNKSQIVRKCGIHFYIYINLHRYRHYSPFPFLIWHQQFLFIFMVWYTIFNCTLFVLTPAIPLRYRKLPRCSFAKSLLLFLLLFKFMTFADNYFHHYHLYWDSDFYHICSEIMQIMNNENFNLLKCFFNFFFFWRFLT